MLFLSLPVHRAEAAHGEFVKRHVESHFESGNIDLFRLFFHSRAKINKISRQVNFRYFKLRKSCDCVFARTLVHTSGRKNTKV